MKDVGMLQSRIKDLLKIVECVAFRLKYIRFWNTSVNM